MNKPTQWLTLVPNVGLAAGLIFLAVELSQNNTLMRANAYQERSDDLIEMSAMIIESEVLSSAISKIDFRNRLCMPAEFDVDSLTGQEVAVLKEFLLAQLFRLQNLDQQFRFGLLEDRYHRFAVISTLRLYLPVWERFEIEQRTLAEAILNAYDEPIPDRCELSGAPNIGDPE